ncbi:MAG: hypothetical protein AB1896_02580 [Thermodesulfobacteriota bacterium]
MDEKKIRELTDRVAAMRKEAEALAAEGPSFPAIWRNAVRALACIRMMETGLGQSSLPDKD